MLTAALGDLGRVRQVVRLFGMDYCAPEFNAMPAVIDGCSNLSIEVFGDDVGRRTWPAPQWEWPSCHSTSLWRSRRPCMSRAAGSPGGRTVNPERPREINAMKLGGQPVAEEMKGMFRTLVEEVFNRGNFDVADDLVAVDFHNHEAPDSPGPEGFKATARWLRRAFPDYHAEVHELVADGDLIVGRLTVSGTHQSDFMGMPATGRSFSVQHLHMYRVEEGKLAEHWACRDDLGQLAQLGLLPDLGAR
jgi:steroid delta-isomerase-like uncharacterized protein